MCVFGTYSQLHNYTLEKTISKYFQTKNKPTIKTVKIPKLNAFISNLAFIDVNN